MPPTRRELLAAGLALLGGCVADPSRPGGTSTATQTPTPDPSETPYDDGTPTGTVETATDWPSDAAVTFPDGPKARPERPDSLSEKTVRSYVRTHEYRYVYNELWMGEGTEVDLSCEVHDATRVRDGYEVVVGCTGYAEVGGESAPDSTATSTMVHADYFTQYHTYYVDSDLVARRSSTAEEQS